MSGLPGTGGRKHFSGDKPDARSVRWGEPASARGRQMYGDNPEKKNKEPAEELALRSMMIDIWILVCVNYGCVRLLLQSIIDGIRQEPESVLRVPAEGDI